MKLGCMLFVLFAQWLGGMFIVRRLLSLRKTRGTETSAPFTTGCHQSIVEMAGTGLILSVGLSSWMLFIWSFAGGLLGQMPSLLLAGLGALGGATILIHEWKAGSRSRNEAATSPIIHPKSERSFQKACLAITGMVLVSTIAQALLTPQRFWDERAMFALKAAVLWEDRSIHSRDLADPTFVQGHPRYPLLLPLAEQQLYALLDSSDDRWGKLVVPLLFIGLVLAIAGTVTRRWGIAWGWLSALLTATIPALMPHEYGVICAQADAPVACLHGMTALVICDALERKRLGESGLSKPLFLAGIFCGLTAFAKDEGIAFFIVDVVALGIASLFQMMRSRNIPEPSRSCGTEVWSVRSACTRMTIGIVCFVLGALLIIVPWMAHRRSLPMTTEMNYFGRLSLSLLVERLSTLAWSVPHLIHRMFVEFPEWGLQWWLMIVAIVIAPRRALRPSQVFLALDVLGGVSALLVAGMLAPVQLEEHIGGSSHRFLMQLAPVAVLFVVGQFANERPARMTPSNSDTGETVL